MNAYVHNNPQSILLNPIPRSGIGMRQVRKIPNLKASTYYYPALLSLQVVLSQDKKLKVKSNYVPVKYQLNPAYSHISR